MRFASLGSGSEGNALIVEAGRTRVMMDCGFGLQETVLRLARLGLAPEELSGIVLTHEHGDHICGAAKFARKFKLPIWLTYGTAQCLRRFLIGVAQVFTIDNHARFHIGDLDIEPYPVPHDAREPTQFVFSNGAKRLGVLTDAGYITAHIKQVLNRCDALVLECNHDAMLLQESSYPFRLKQRIAGRFGHLSNYAAAGLLTELDCGQLQHLIAAHLSRQNNTSAIARQALSAALNCEPEWIGVADQESGLDWRQIS